MVVKADDQYLAYPSQHLVDYLSHLAIKFDVSIVGTIIHSDADGLPEISPFAHLHTSSSRETSIWSEYVRDHPVTNHSPKLRNVAFFIEAGSGKVLDEYAKRNLWHPERDYLSPGEAGHQVFETKWGRCAFLICEQQPGLRQDPTDGRLGCLTSCSGSTSGRPRC